MTKINHEEYEVLKEHYDMGGKWIARDVECNSLNVFSVKPIKTRFQWDYLDVGYKHAGLTKKENKMFQFIQWEDEKPHNIAELIEEYEIENGMRYDFGKIKVIDIDTSKLATHNDYIYVKESEETEMKKDKLWAKIKVHEELDSWRNVEGGIDEDGIKYVLNIIDQLDETEVLSQEWIDEHAMEVTYDEILDQPEIVYVVELKNLLVPKQELPVVPKFVADWWERDDDSVTMYEGVHIEKKHKLDLVSFFQDRGLSDSLSEVEDWLDENDSIFLDLVNGKPYEVEKEKLYIVQLPTSSEDDLIILDADGVIWKDCWPSQYKMTEQRIKEIDERYWPFAMEVAE